MIRTTLVITMIGLAIAMTCGVGRAQPAFDAVSVKAAPPPDGRGRRVAMMGGPGTDTPGRINFENVGLGGIIRKAYGVAYYQISGPDWLTGPGAARFNVIGALPPATTQEQFRLMLQNLLAERFKLKLHTENKEMAIFVLGVAKNGPKLRIATPELPPDANDAADGSSQAGGGRLARDAEGYPVLGPGMTMAIVGDHARFANKERMQWLVDMLAGQTGRPVVDATGLTEKYDFSLSWIPRPPDALPAEDPAGPDLFSALQQQMGLKLEPKKGPVEVLVIDRAEKIPTAN